MGFADKLEQVQQAAKEKHDLDSEIFESKSQSNFPVGDIVVVPTGLSYIGECWNETAVLDKDSRNIVSKITKVDSMCVSLAFRLPTGETATRDVTMEAFFAKGNKFYDLVSAGLEEDETIDETEHPMMLLGKPAVIRVTGLNSKFKEIMSPQEHQLQENSLPDLEKVSPKFWTYKDNTPDTIKKLSPFGLHQLTKNSVAENPDWEKTSAMTQSQLEDRWFSYSSENTTAQFDSLVKEKGK